jgi:hypothetical protein
MLRSHPNSTPHREFSTAPWSWLRCFCRLTMRIDRQHAGWRASKGRGLPPRRLPLGSRFESRLIECAFPFCDHEYRHRIPDHVCQATT